MYETTFDKMMYPVGFKTTVKRGIRRWRNLPALTEGQPVTIARLDWRQEQWGPSPRVLVTTEDGKQRWINGTNVEPCTTGNEAAHARLGEIAEEFFARRD